MNTARIAKWSPRVLAIFFTLFLSLFALDAFSGDSTIGEKLAGFAIHLLPSALLAWLIHVSWDRPQVGGIVFLLFSLFSIFAFDTYGQWQSLLLITGLPFLTGLLFMLSAGKSETAKKPLHPS